MHVEYHTLTTGTHEALTFISPRYSYNKPPRTHETCSDGCWVQEDNSPPDSGSSGGHDTTLTKPREILATLRSILVRLVRSTHCGIWVGSTLRWTLSYIEIRCVALRYTAMGVPHQTLSHLYCGINSRVLIHHSAQSTVHKGLEQPSLATVYCTCGERVAPNAALESE